MSSGITRSRQGPCASASASHFRRHWSRSSSRCGCSRPFPVEGTAPRQARVRKPCGWPRVPAARTPRPAGERKPTEAEHLGRIHQSPSPPKSGHGRGHRSCLSPAAASSGPPGTRRTAVDAGLTRAIRAARSPGRQVPAELGWRAVAAGRTGTTVNGASPRRDSGGYPA
jgi:hypothetical protein